MRLPLVRAKRSEAVITYATVPSDSPSPNPAVSRRSTSVPQGDSSAEARSLSRLLGIHRSRPLVEPRASYVAYLEFLGFSSFVARAALKQCFNDLPRATTRATHLTHQLRARLTDTTCPECHMRGVARAHREAHREAAMYSHTPTPEERDTMDRGLRWIIKKLGEAAAQRSGAADDMHRRWRDDWTHYPIDLD